jgi:large subunit ribosomal protein L32e
MKALLKVRAEKKARKPRFARQGAGKKIEVGTKYRKPTGYQSKMRRRQLGYSPMPSQGWRAPAEVRGLSKDGLEPVVVCNVKDLVLVDPKKQVVIIGTTVGGRKRILILEKAQELNVAIEGLVVADELNKLKSGAKSRHDAKQKLKTDRQKKAKAKEASAKKVKKEDTKKEETEKDAEAKAEEIRKEQEKVLIDKKTAQ